MVPSSRRSIVTAGSPNEIARSGWDVSARAGASTFPAGTDMLDFALMSGGLHLCGLAVEESTNPEFCLFIALRHRRHQGLHQEAGLRIGLGNHRQRLQHGEIRQRRIVRSEERRVGEE